METGAGWKGFKVGDHSEGQESRLGVRTWGLLELNCCVTHGHSLSLSLPLYV